jgi:hypothetical protein
MEHSGHQSLSQCGFTQRGFLIYAVENNLMRGGKICRTLKILNTRVSKLTVTN